LFRFFSFQFIFICMILIITFFCLFFLVFSVCEGLLGLSVLVYMIRSHCNDYFQSYSVFNVNVKVSFFSFWPLCVFFLVLVINLLFVFLYFFHLYCFPFFCWGGLGYFCGCDLISYGLILWPQWTACFEFKIISENSKFYSFTCKRYDKCIHDFSRKTWMEKQLGRQRCNWEDNTGRNTEIILGARPELFWLRANRSDLSRTWH